MQQITIFKTLRALVMGLLMLGMVQVSAQDASNSTDWQQMAKLIASDGAAQDIFGSSLSIDGNRALIGTPGDDSSGAAYIFNLTSGDELLKLLPDDTTTNFGISVALHGNIALVGADGDNASSGAAYVFDATTGDQLHKLTATDAASGAFFGFSVSLDGNIALVGAPGADDSGFGSGTAYLFDVTTGNQLHKLTPDATSFYAGYSVSLSGNRALVGAYGDTTNGFDSGAAYVFDTATGNQLQKLTASGGAMFDWFGWSVALDGNTALIGAFNGDGNGFDSGAAYVFDITTGNQRHQFTGTDTTAGDAFGYAVALVGDVALVGACSGSLGDGVYLYDIATETQIDKLVSDDAVAGDFLGCAVALAADLALVGAYGDDDDGTNSGSAYVFAPPSGQPDATATAFDALPDAVNDAPIDLSYSIYNAGDAALTNLQVDFLLADEMCDEQTAVLLDSITVTQIDPETTHQGTHAVTIAQADLYANALDDTPPFPPLNTPSPHIDHICMVLDPQNAIDESDETNNANIGAGIDADDITALVWDIDADTWVTPLDVMYVVNRIGGDDLSADINGDGAVTTQDAQDALERMGYRANTSVSE